MTRTKEYAFEARIAVLVWLGGWIYSADHGYIAPWAWVTFGLLVVGRWLQTVTDLARARKEPEGDQASWLPWRNRE